MGAVVLAYWPVADATESPRGSLMVVEDVTTESGHFRLKAWGPVGPLQTDELYLDEDGPKILIFKHGYSVVTASNISERDAAAWNGTLTADWDGREVRLKPYEGSE